MTDQREWRVALVSVLQRKAVVKACDCIAVVDLEILKGGGKNIYFYHRCVYEYPSGIEYYNKIA